MLHDVFLDFFNRDSRQIYGLDRLGRETHLSFLIEALTVAAFLCRDHCVLPAGFLAESRLCRESLLERRSEYLDERLVRLSIKEYSLDEFWEKKRRQYQPFRQKYEGLFDPKNHDLLRSVSQAIISRNVDIGKSILAGWEEGPDANSIWRGRIHDLAPGPRERIRAIPRQILDNGIAITWPAIAMRITDQVDIPTFRPILQNVYFSPYLVEYDLRVITSLPHTSHSFVGPAPDVSYDWDALREALSAAGIWNVVLTVSAPSMVYLRSTGGYIRFRDAFDTIAARTQSVHDVRRIFALAAEARRPKAKFRDAVRRNSGPVVPVHGVAISEPDMDEFAERLTEIATSALEIAHLSNAAKARTTTVTKGNKVSGSSVKDVAIFVALELERKILIERWGLKGSGLEQVWHGDVGNAHISLFGRDEMGRVPAAVATMEFLSKIKRKPDLLLILGIAGGFAREGISYGDVLIPASVVDLASRKIREDDRRIPEFRPKEFPIDDRIAKYLRAGFNMREWEMSVIKDAEWPDGLRPAIKYGPIASLDEVVADKGFAERLCNFWPKLLGIEMEAGGVCAAAETFGIRPAAIRGVSDLADPSKSDTEWRRRAMKTVAHLVERFDFDVLLCKD